MRTSMFLAAAATVAVLSSTAAADSPAPRPVAAAESDLATTVTAVFDRADKAALVATFAPKVTVDGLAFADAACDKAFGKGKHRVIAKKLHAKLAACLLRAAWRPATGQEATFEGDSLRYDSEHDDNTASTVDIGFVVARGKVKISSFSLIEGELGGVMGGVEGGVVGGDVTQPVDISAVPLPPPPPPPQIVPVTALEASRLTGDKNIVPDVATQKEIHRSGKTKVVAAFKLCVTVSGAISSVVTLKSSGFPAYDADLTAGIRTWTYRPFLVNGHAVSVCSAVTFVFTQK